MNANRIWTFGGVLAVAVILVLGWVLGVSPLLNQAAVADAEREGVEQLNAAEMAELERMKAQYEQIDELRIELANLRVSLPGEADTDFVYSLLNGVQASTGANVASITTGAAVPYGASSGDEPASADAAAATAVPQLYTVPITITFDQVPADRVFAFANAMQTGPRLFLVTSLTGDGAGASTITAYMFVLRDENAPRGGAAQALSGIVPTPTPEATPTPTDTATPAPGESATPSPTPTP